MDSCHLSSYSLKTGTDLHKEGNMIAETLFRQMILDGRNLKENMLRKQRVSLKPFRKVITSREENCTFGEQTNVALKREDISL